MSLQAFSPEAELKHCRERERFERNASAAATDPAVRDAHSRMAERYADQAWSIAERFDIGDEPTGLWK